MTRRDHAILTSLATGGALIVLFQCWYVSLPLEEATRIDLCRLTPVINCFLSLYAHGSELFAFGLPVFPLLAGLFLFQAALCAFAWGAQAARREAWLVVACLASFPASGLAIFVLLNDLMVAKATSVSALLVAASSLSLSVITVLRGVRRPRLTDAGRGGIAIALWAALAASFVGGAGSSRRAVDELLRETESARPAIKWADFARDIPRTGAATLGNLIADTEVILIIDPAQESSRKLMREAAELMPRQGDRVLLTIYAKGGHDADLVLAAREGKLNAYLTQGKKPSGDPASVASIVEWHERAVENFEAPTALWKGGKRSGEFRLAEILQAAARP